MKFVKLGKTILFVKLFLFNNVLLFAQRWNPEMEGPPEEWSDSSMPFGAWFFSVGLWILSTWFLNKKFGTVGFLVGFFGGAPAGIWLYVQLFK